MISKELNGKMCPAGNITAKSANAKAFDDGCDFCLGDEAVFWQNSGNNAFIDSQGKMLVTVNGHELQFSVEFCPKCGKKFSNIHNREGGSPK